MLFAYLQDHPLEGVETYFVINEDSPDYERMKEIGKVVPYNSDEHKKLHLVADKIISSAADDFVINCFGKLRWAVQAFLHYDFVFLQHGITQNDISGWVNKYKKDIALFVTAAKPEYEAITSNPAYGYGSDVVAMTGFPRHDVLFAKAAASQPERKILIAPTWRQNLAGNLDSTTGMRDENPDFERSNYYRFYNGLINNQRLAEAAREFDFTIDFLVHPAFMQEAHKFSSDFANVVRKYDYANEFATSSIMVTDYSSVAFDFALLKKPIIYAQFDYIEFYQSHPWGHGYYSYSEDGFGPICSTLEETVDFMVAAMKNPKMPEKYRKRVDGFFFQPEKSRCEAVVEAICALDAKEE